MGHLALSGDCDTVDNETETLLAQVSGQKIEPILRLKADFKPVHFGTMKSKPDVVARI
jgi:hypothetical protein